jgi:hypothetical protein
MSGAQQEAMQIEAEAWTLVQAFDDAAADQDRRVPYAALILIMTSFIKTSHVDAATILTDFCQRVGGGVAAGGAVRQ